MSSSQASGRRLPAGVVPLGVVIAVWATGYLAIGLAVTGDGGFGPLYMNGTRLVLAAVLLLVGLRAFGRPVVPARGHLLRMAGVGVLAWSIGNGLQVIGQQGVAPGLTALIMASSAALAVGLSAAWDRRLPTPLQGLSVGLGLAGVGLLVGASPAGAAPWALGALVIASLGWAAGSVAAARQPKSGGPIADAAWQMLFGGMGLVLLAVARGEPLPTPSAVGLAAWAWLAVGNAAIAYPLWVIALRKLPMHVCMTQSTLSPAIAVALSAAFLDEAFGPRTVPGMVLALGGAALAGFARDGGPGVIASPPGRLRRMFARA